MIETSAAPAHAVTEAIVNTLRKLGGVVSVSDLWFALPSPRPGRIELERLLLIREDLFRMKSSDQVELVAVQSPTLAVDPSAFSLPEPGPLIGYYEGCVREDGRRVRCYQTHIGISALETETEWVSDRRGVYSIPVTPENRDVILNNSNASAAHYYGYPILAEWQDEENTMKYVPILFWKLDRMGDSHAVSHRLSFTLSGSDFRLNHEVLRSLPQSSRKRVAEMFENASSLSDCLELIDADFLGLAIKERL